MGVFNKKKIKSFLNPVKNCLTKNMKKMSNSIIGIDLGTENTLFYVQGKGVVYNIPSVVASFKEDKKKQSFFYGQDAKDMIGKTPLQIKITETLEDGVISNNIECENLISYYLNKLEEEYAVLNPVVIVGVPYSATEFEERNIQETIERCRVKNVFLIYETIADAVENDLTLDKPFGSMVIDVGGGTTEISIISLGGIIKNRSFKYGGKKMDKAIVEYIKQKYHLLIGINTAEDIKKQIGCLYIANGNDIRTMEVKGRDLNTHTPKTITVSQEDTAIALAEYTNELVENVKIVLQETPPELIKDIFSKSVIICGGCANLKNIDYVLNKTTNLNITIPKNPLLCVINGIGKITENFNKYKNNLFQKY